MATRYPVRLTPEERSELDSIVRKGNNPARSVVLALVLLFCDLSPEGRGFKTNVAISRDLNISERTIESVKRRFAEGGISLALQRKPKALSLKPLKFDGAFEAGLVALARSEPPPGRARWTVRLLAEKLVESGLAPQGVSHMTVQRALKKSGLDLASESEKSRESAPRNS